jgi:inosine-uridine nucleoside N-ribohydrolase
MQPKTPVILDTDIGTDIDDTWALAMLLKCPELDTKLVVSDTGDTDCRARIVAKMLETAGRSDIPIGVGIPFPKEKGLTQKPWVEDYPLSAYPGSVLEDGVSAIIDTIMNSAEPVTLICIGPVPNIAAALRREPRIVENARFIGMHGSVRRGYFGSEQIHPEFNVVRHCSDCQEVFSASWDMTITPLDTCGLVVLDGQDYQLVRECRDPLIEAMFANYGIWLDQNGRPESELEQRSSVLFDTVAVYLAFSQDLLVMEDLGIRVDDEGYTRIDEDAKVIHVATNWRDLPAFKRFLAERLAG